MTNIILSKEHGKDVANMRDAYCRTLIDIAKEDPRIVVLDADLLGALGMKPFQKEFPDRTIDCGIMEGEMVGVACGLAVQGKIPFAHSFGPFMTRRACDQIFISGAYNKANVKLVGSDPGITASYNGGTHMPFEDMGIMRGIPTTLLVEPTDVVMLKNLLPQIVDHEGITYIRMVRKEVNKVYEEGSSFELGKAAVISEGTDVTFIASGYCMVDALSAAEKLAAEGISAGVINMFTWKPIDEEAILKAAAQSGAIVTCENHNVINGLGSAVAEVLVKNKPVPVEMIGSQDEFGEVGPVSYLRERFHLTDDDMVAAAKKAIARK